MATESLGNSQTGGIEDENVGINGQETPEVAEPQLFIEARDIWATMQDHPAGTLYEIATRFSDEDVDFERHFGDASADFPNAKMEIEGDHIAREAFVRYASEKGFDAGANESIDSL